MSAEGNAGNVWNAGTLEWLPNGNYSNRSIPTVAGLYPLWDRPSLAKEVEDGAHYLPGSATGTRETILTSAVDASPQWLLRLPMPGWAPVIAAWFTAAFFLLLTFKLVAPALLCGVVALGALLRWGWELDPPPRHPAVHVGGGVRLPDYATGPGSQAWWAIVILMLVAGALYDCLLFSYLYLWTVSPQVWPAAMPSAALPLSAAGLVVASSAAVGYANRQLKRRGGCEALLLAVPLLIVAFLLNVRAQEDVSPTDSAYGAIVYTVLSVDGFFVAVAVTLALYALARRAAGLLDGARRVNFDNARLFWHYVAAQTLAGMAMVHGFPRLVE
jgi:cytochrome c oxidase subunit I+III